MELTRSRSPYDRDKPDRFGRVGSGGTDVLRAVIGVRNFPALQRRCGARGAHHRGAMVSEGLRDEGHTAAFAGYSREAARKAV
jgi:hypothetical protein